MRLLSATHLITCNDNFEIIKDGAIVFDKSIIEVGAKDDLLSKYKNMHHTHYENCVITPALINAHVHLEYSANSGSLEYGGFMKWLRSVIANRDELSSACGEECLKSAINQITRSGTATIGAISSFGSDLEALADSKLKSVYFVEAIGSNPSAIDALYADFKARFEGAKAFKSERFKPSVAIHSPYSIHPVFIKKVLEIARNENMPVSTHFLESREELEWLESGAGEFGEFMKAFNPHAKPMCEPLEFLEFFDEQKTLFTHCVYADKAALEKIRSQGGTITHCPRSNRLLDGKMLDLKRVLELGVDFVLATDGLSSNSSLSLLDEARAALFMHENIKLYELAKMLFLGMTRNGAKALGLNSGELSHGKCADIAVFSIPKEAKEPISALLLNAKEVTMLYIDGEKVC